MSEEKITCRQGHVGKENKNMKCQFFTCQRTSLTKQYTVDAFIFRISNCRKPSGKLRKVCLINLIAKITTARFPLGNQLKVSNRKTICQNFLLGNLLKISLAFPLDFLAGKLKNAGSGCLLGPPPPC